MNRFAPLLERTAHSLELPQPQKARLLEELAADAADLYEHLRRRGMEEAAALAEVERWLLTDPQSIRELHEIHLPLHLRWASRFTERRRHRLERFVLAVVVSGLMLAALPLITSSALVNTQLRAAYALVAGAALVAAVALDRGIALWIHGRYDDDARRGLKALGLLTVAAPVAAVLDAAATLAARAGEAAGDELWRALQSAAGLLAAGLILALLSGATWIALETRVRRLERLDAIWKEDG